MNYYYFVLSQGGKESAVECFVGTNQMEEFFETLDENQTTPMYMALFTRKETKCHIHWLAKSL